MIKLDLKSLPRKRREKAATGSGKEFRKKRKKIRIKKRRKKTRIREERRLDAERY